MAFLLTFLGRIITWLALETAYTPHSVSQQDGNYSSPDTSRSRRFTQFHAWIALPSRRFNPIGVFVIISQTSTIVETAVKFMGAPGRASVPPQPCSVCLPSLGGSEPLPISWHTLLLKRLDHDPREDMDDKEIDAKLAIGEEARFNQILVITWLPDGRGTMGHGVGWGILA
ncbi:hypothetical protein BJV78DRAFT_1356299 [Lactifluus subvellereus]|nr:hypothetical protein BJV78DRAFT_1356299 [Lactifluus subvellereus]